MGSVCVRLARAFSLHPSTELGWLVDGCESVSSHVGFSSAAVLWELVLSVLWREGVARGRIDGRVSPLHPGERPDAGRSAREGGPPVQLAPAPERIHRAAAERMRLLAGGAPHSLTPCILSPGFFPADAGTPRPYVAPAEAAESVQVMACPDADDSLSIPEAVRQRTVAAGRVRCALFCYTESRALLGSDLFGCAAVPLTLRPELVAHVTFFHVKNPRDDSLACSAAGIVTGSAQLACSSVMAAMQLERLRSTSGGDSAAGEVI
eukprot:gene7692-23008_t